MQKSTQNSSILNILTLPLTGRRLIEASAGTGKTFSITHIYLRLLLGLGENNFVRPLSVQEILVVTFTNASTEELRSRIRQAIVDIKLLFLSEQPDPNSDLYPFVSCAQKQQKDLAKLIQLLVTAEQSMDEAAIYTIDGFSLKMSKQFSLLLKETEELTLIEDQDALLLNSAQAFWRTYFYPIQSPLLANEITQTFGSPQTLFTQLIPFFNASSFIEHLETKPIPQILSDFEANLKLYQNGISKIKQLWQTKKVNLVQNLVSVKLHQGSYSEQKILSYLEVVDAWCRDELNLEYPKALENFHFSNLEAKKTKNSNLAQLDPFFATLEASYANLPAKPILLSALFESLLNEVYLDLNAQKQQNQLFAHGDPLKKLVNGLNDPFSKPILTSAIHALFPVALIDEFQDTDALQYQFFDQIYQDKTNSGLILIGDPKQAIYGFRGGDVFTYIQAKNQADSIYSIQRNYRSSKALIESVNAIFAAPNVFKYAEIPFHPVQFAERNKFKTLCFDLNNPKDQMEFSFEIHAVDCAEADFCAAKIAQWLTKPAYLIDAKPATNAKPLQASDIAILVRSSAQALQMQIALSHYSISSSYFSDRESVFKSIEATWIFYLLEAILNPSQLSKISLAGATPLFNLTMLELQSIQEEGRIEQLVQQLVLLEKCYQKSGIYVMLQTLLTQNQIAATLLQLEQGNRHVTNLLHLSELLQTASQTHQSLHTLTEWLRIQIDKTTSHSQESVQRLDNDENVIKIFTLHGSKGLEFPVVCLPFLSKMEAKTPKQPFLYHNEIKSHQAKSYPLCLALEKEDIAQQQKIKEDEAELIRLAYVAMTRPVYHCLAILKEPKATSTKKASLIGNLLLQQKLIPIQQSTLFDVPKCANQSQKPTHLEVATLTRTIDATWQMSSYSSVLQQQLPFNAQASLQPQNVAEMNHVEELILSELASDEQITVNQPILLHDFPKGAFVGTLLHQLFEKSQLNAVLAPELVAQIVLTLNLDPSIYTPMIHQFYQQVVQTPLTATGLTLSQIPFEKQLNEFHFLLPIKHYVTERQFNHLIQTFDPLSKQAPHLQFEILKGMLTGFIDLVFESEGKYYIADYKSNYLGVDQADYHETQLSKAMIHHRYDLQYQLYTLALHRYLRLRLPDYDYAKDFGGVFYLFLRGMNGESQNGVYFCRPEFAFIQQLDDLFTK